MHQNWLLTMKICHLLPKLCSQNFIYRACEWQCHRVIYYKEYIIRTVLIKVVIITDLEQKQKSA